MGPKNKRKRSIAKRLRSKNGSFLSNAVDIGVGDVSTGHNDASETASSPPGVVQEVDRPKRQKQNDEESVDIRHHESSEIATIIAS